MTEREWGPMFRQASRQKPGAEAPRLPPQSSDEPDFGTALTGEHSAHELDDLLRAKQSEIDDITAHVQKLPASGDATWQQWALDWGKFTADWKSIVARVRPDVEAAKAGGVSSWIVSQIMPGAKDPWDSVWLEDDYQAVLHVLQPGGLGTSRVQDLYRRYLALPQSTPIKFRPTPQPTAPDIRLAAETGRPVFQVPPVVTQAENLSLSDLNPLSFIKKVPWWGWAIGGTVVVGAGVTVLKASPLGMVLRVLR
jgi:hypothetical protein